MLPRRMALRRELAMQSKGGGTSETYAVLAGEFDDFSNETGDLMDFGASPNWEASSTK